MIRITSVSQAAIAAFSLCRFLASQETTPQVIGANSSSAAPNTTKGSVSGSVTDGQGGVPIPAARVFLRSTRSKATGAFLTMSDREGRFAIHGIDPGSYTLIAAKGGYVTGEYGADRTTSGRAIVLEAGQNVPDLNVRLWPPAVVTGRVLDENNTPVVFANVQCMRVDYSTGRRRLAPAHGTSTNDLGEYRIFGGQPGRYVVTANYHGPPNVIRADQIVLSPEAIAASAEGYLPAFYGNATSVETATPIDLVAGSEAHGIDMHLSRTRIAHVRGVILGSGGLPVRAGSVMLWRVDSAGRSSMGPETSRLAPGNGSFEFSDVTPGSYLLGVNGSANGVDREDAWKAIQVGEADVELKITLSKPIEIKGSIVIEGSSEQPARVTVSLESTRLTGRQSVEIRPGEPFSFKNLPPDAYGVYVASDNPDLYVRSVKLANTDFTDLNVEVSQGGELNITLVGGGGEVKGTVESADHSPAIGVTVVLIPNTPPTGDRPAIQVDGHGRQRCVYSFSGIAPGGYRVFAWEDAEMNAWKDPDFLRPVESLGQQIKVEQNSHTSVSLTSIPKATTNNQ